MDIVKNINWQMISLDSLLDFIISQSKLLINSPELQSVVIAEFSRRLKDEYTNNEEQIIDKSGNMFSNSPKRKNSLSQHSYTKPQTYSFTSDLITKLIKIASKYETPYSTNNINLTGKSQNSRNGLQGANMSKHSSAIGVINTSPDNSYNKTGKQVITPPSEAEYKDESSGKVSSKVSKSSVSPFGQNIKKNQYGFSNVMENSHMIRKIVHNNALAKSKGDKYSHSTNKLENFNKSAHNSYQSSSVKPLGKNLTNRSLHREFSSSNLLQMKSKSISNNNDRSTKTSSIDKGKKLSVDKVIKNYQNIKNEAKMNIKVKYSPIYNLSKNNLNMTSGAGNNGNINQIVTNVNSGNQVISTGKSRKTPKAFNSNIVVEDTSPQLTNKKTDHPTNPTTKSYNITNMTNNLTYHQMKTSKENISNVKFIKKDNSTRPKSAAAYRNNVNISLNNLNFFKK